MYEKSCLFLAFVLYISVVSESRVIVPPIKDESFGNEEIPFSMNPLETGKRSAPPTDYDDYEGIPSILPTLYDDYNGPDMDDNLPGTKPERFPSGAGRDKIPQENPKENDGIDKSGDENFNKPLDKEDSDEFGKNDKDLGPSLDKDKPVHKDGDELETGIAGPEESEKDKKDKEYKPEEEIPDEEKWEEEENEEKWDEEKWEEEENEENPDEEKKEEEEDREKPVEEKEEELDEEKPDWEEEENEEKLDEEKNEEEVEEKPDREEEENEEKLDEEKKEEDQEKPHEEKEEELDEENPDEERKVEEEEKHEIESGDDKKHVTEEELIDDDNEEEKIPKEVDEETDENDSKNKDGIPQKGDASFLGGGSIFDTPFFNLEKVKNYFSKLDRALGHVFRQTIDEALLLNGTYANTTEEEVDIDGKKYIITKSVIKGADNHSSMYIESLSAKPKMNYTEEMKDNEIKNLTQT